MADAIGLAASLVGLLEITSAVVRLSHSYILDVKNAKRSQKLYLQEITAFLNVLLRAEAAYQEAHAVGSGDEFPSSLEPVVLHHTDEIMRTLLLDLEKNKHKLRWPFQEKELKSHLDELVRLRGIFETSLGVANLRTTTATLKNTEALMVEQKKHTLLNMVPIIHGVWRSRPIASPGTGQWFLQSSEYSQWKHGKERSLWCYGAPGVGKSLLASIAVDNLLTMRTDHSTSVAYFFCDFSSRYQQKPLAIFQCVFRQIIEQGDPEMITEAYERCTDSPILQEVGGICDVLTKMCAKWEIFLVVDALDELDDMKSISVLLSALANAGLHLLVMSRDVSEIRRNFGSFSLTEVRSNVEDVSKYVSQRFRESEHCEDDSDLPRFATIIAEIVLRTGNIFLLSKLMVDGLLEFESLRKMRIALNASSTSLDGAYEATLQRINEQPRPKRILAHRLLAWVTHAKRRLRISEIIEAFAIEDDSDIIDDESYIRSDQLLRTCIGVVLMDQNDQTVGLFHKSAHDFFKRFTSEADPDWDIANSCLGYLSLKIFQCTPSSTAAELTNRFKQNQFLQYAASFWGAHVAENSIKTRLESKTLSLLKNASLRTNAFQALQFQTDLLPETRDALFLSIPTGQSPLHLGAFWNLSEIVDILLREGEDASKGDSSGWTPLHWACYRGHHAVTDVLIKGGANLNKQDAEGWTPLFWASLHGHVDITHQLLAAGADHLVASNEGWTALHWAISRQQQLIVPILLSHHIDYSKRIASVTKKTSEQPSQHIGVEKNNLFDALILPQLEVNDFDKIWASQGFNFPISTSVWKTRSKMYFLEMRKIQRSETDVDQLKSDIKYQRLGIDGSHWNPQLLMSAIRVTNLPVVQLLLNFNVDVNYREKNGEQNTPLHLAAYNNNPKFVQELLQAGADRTVKNKTGRWPLHVAIDNALPETIRALVDDFSINHKASVTRHWIDTDRTSPIYPWFRLTPVSATPLIMACFLVCHTDSRSSVHEILQLLIAQNASPSILDSRGMTALHYICLYPDLNSIQYLLDAGAEVDIADDLGRTPLHILFLSCLIRPNDSEVEVVESQSIRLLLDRYSNLREVAIQYLSEATILVIAELLKDVTTYPPYYRNRYFMTDSNLSIKNLPQKLAQILSTTLDAGATMNIPRTAIKSYDLTEIVQHIDDHTAIDILLQFGGDPFQSGPHFVNAFVAAIIHENYNTLRRLVEFATSQFGMDVQRSDELIQAARDASTAGDELYRFIFEYIPQNVYKGHDVDLFHRVNAQDQTLLHQAANVNHGGSVTLVRYLISRGVDFETPDTRGFLPFHYAVAMGHAEMARVLSDFPNHPDPRTSLGPCWKALIRRAVFLWPGTATMIETTVFTENEPLLRLLLELGADIEHHYPLRRAAYGGHVGMVSLMLSFGADPNRKERHCGCGILILHYDTALAAACANGHIEVADRLVKAGAHTDWPKAEGDAEKYIIDVSPPLFVATYDIRTDVIRFLLDAGADANRCAIGKLGCCYKSYEGTALGLLLHECNNRTLEEEIEEEIEEEKEENSWLEACYMLVTAGADTAGVLCVSTRRAEQMKKYKDLWAHLDGGKKITIVEEKAVVVGSTS